MAGERRILVIKCGAMGDLLQMTPVFRALKDAMPQCRITTIVGTKESANLFRYNPDVDETLVYERKGEHRSAGAFFRFWKLVGAARYDLVLNFQRSSFATWVLAAAAFPARILIYHRARGRIVHAVVNYLETLKPLGIALPAEIPPLRMMVSSADEESLSRLLEGEGLAGKRLVALNPGATHPVNRWSAANFAALADMVAAETGASVVIPGGPADVEAAMEIARLAASSPVVLAGRTNFLELAALLKRCDVVVSGDTGPMHMATAVGTPVVALFGAADPLRTGPVGDGHVVVTADEPCVPCRSRSCDAASYMECMQKIEPERVMRELRRFIGRG
jgi:heptosyltransferase II